MTASREARPIPPNGPSGAPIPYPEWTCNPVAINAHAGKLGELALLKQIRGRAAQLANGGLRLGIGDDCALLRVGAGEELAVTTDLSISGRHFRLDWQTPESIGHRTLARGLSDLAAMGARPVAAFLSLGVPKELVQNAKGRGAGRRTGPAKCARSWLDGFFDGFFALATPCKRPWQEATWRNRR